MTDTPGVLAIFGGTFDPIHIGHLRAAMELHARLALEKIVLVPCGEPAHRGPPGADAEHRLGMCRTASEDLPYLAVDDCEIRRPGPSYMVDTLADFRGRFPAHSLCLVLGSDAFSGLDRWHQPHRLTELAHLLVINRPGVDLKAPASWGKLRPTAASHRGLTASLAGGVFRIDLPQLDISASRLRESLRCGADTRWLLPGAVARYIDEQRLYAQ